MENIRSSMAAANMLKPYLADSGNEEIWILILQRFKPVLPVKINTGGTDAVAIDYKHIIKEIILNDGDAVILFHNHPSNNPHPSMADIKETKNMRNALDIVGISLIDHIILTSRCFYSFADKKVKKYVTPKKTASCNKQR